jgi:hypothetical protein
VSQVDESDTTGDPETVSPEERRRAIDMIAHRPLGGLPTLDPRLLETIERAAVEEQSEAFDGETFALARLIAEHKPSLNIEAEILCRCTEALLLAGGDGTSASLLALGRAVAAFALNDVANWTVLADRQCVREGTPAGPATDGSTINFAEAAGRIRARRRSQRGKPL